MEFSPELLDYPRAMRGKWLFVGDESILLQHIQKQLGSQVAIARVDPPKKGKNFLLQHRRANSALKRMKKIAEGLSRGDVLFFGDIMEWTKPDIEDTSFGIRPQLLLTFLDINLDREDIFVCAFVSPSEKESVPATFTRPSRFGRTHNLAESVAARLMTYTKE